MKKFLAYLDNNLLTILTAFLIAFIPLYPKIPMAELIQGYIVRMRLEDLLVMATSLVYLLQLLRRRVHFPKNLLTVSILTYLGFALLSVLSSLFITESTPMEKAHVLKLILHYFRRIEYFALFFITYSAIRTKKDLSLFLKVALITTIGIVLYGIGQKYFYFPAFSTMNREFSKGVRLYLQPNTRLFSTFGGHYDLAGYLTIALSFVLPAAYLAKKKLFKLGFYALSVVAYWCLVLTTSRTSFIGYLVGTTVICYLLIAYRGWWWSIRHYVLTVLMSLIIMFSFSTLLERFTQVIPDQKTRDTILTLQKIINQPFVPEPEGKDTVAELPSLLAFLFKNEPLKTIELTDTEKSQLDIVASDSDMPPSPIKPTPKPTTTPRPNLPTDVSEESESIREQSAKDEGREYNGPQYSANALKYGLSMGIRLDVLWPNAIRGFMTNPLLGTGYATLVKSNVGEFTYAESTDNDYLRMLGETGLLGTLAFLTTIYLVIRYSYLILKSSNTKADLLALGAIGATVALLVTATYIDIFESSKVAYTYWILVGMVAYRYDSLPLKKG
ncbi:MAG: hypothetical protein DPW11_02145 [bacterium]|nr:hypothetical protein [Candidatus Microgenomates bacterium CPR3]MCQ3944551.1 hypothetical protein [bacterium]RIK51617.1 MAG: hypothetical protein DCC61_02195 [Candidatus Microgenomates bacterium]